MCDGWACSGPARWPPCHPCATCLLIQPLLYTLLSACHRSQSQGHLAQLGPQEECPLRKRMSPPQFRTVELGAGCPATPTHITESSSILGICLELPGERPFPASCLPPISVLYPTLFLQTWSGRSFTWAQRRARHLIRF
jgi:hypothetical protein